MRSLEDLLHPITPDQFRAEYQGRKPLHVPAGEAAPKAALLDWATFNGLLGQTALWAPETLKLVLNTRPVAPEFYCELADTQTGKRLRPSPAKVNVFLSTGASLVANEVQTLTPNLAETSAMLGQAFAGLVGANVYCSFGGVRAFATHFDLHEVFAVQVEGEKTWRLYENRAEDPVEFPVGDDQVVGWFERTRGRTMQDVLMRPGDVLYLPRGWYHDALAEPGASLHVTFSVTPLYGRILFSLLEKAALQDPAFRAWLPSASLDDGKVLQAHLARLGRKLADLAAHPQFRDEIAMAQQKLVQRPAEYGLPVRAALTGYRRTGLASPAFTGPVAVAMDWAFGQPDFAIEDLCAQFDFVDPDAIRAAVERALAAGALARV